MKKEAPPESESVCLRGCVSMRGRVLRMRGEREGGGGNRVGVPGGSPGVGSLFMNCITPMTCGTWFMA